ncbi:hypothetical protein OKZ62_001725 [Vibrio navarrensis]|nr:hypothetical protein [Vibrio navarrensis]
MYFITDIQSEKETDILTGNQLKRLIVVSLEGQLLATYEAPTQGWTHESLVELSDDFPPQWNVCGADAFLGEQIVGSTEY